VETPSPPFGRLSALREAINVSRNSTRQRRQAIFAVPPRADCAPNHIVATLVITGHSHVNRRAERMTKKTTIRAIGNSAGATIPKAMLERFHLTEGDSVTLVETPDGILITPYDKTFAEAMEIYEEGAKTYRNAMRRLAQ
jgi:putative addiction module antidote